MCMHGMYACAYIVWMCVCAPGTFFNPPHLNTFFFISKPWIYNRIRLSFSDYFQCNHSNSFSHHLITVPHPLSLQDVTVVEYPSEAQRVYVGV